MMSDDGLDDALNLTLDVKLFARNYWKTTKKGEGREGQKLHDVQHPTNPKEHRTAMRTSTLLHLLSQ